ncbi:MAG: hypothetical protein WDW36_003889 [Sanguina aurantia]
MVPAPSTVNLLQGCIVLLPASALTDESAPVARLRLGGRGHGSHSPSREQTDDSQGLRARQVLYVAVLPTPGNVLLDITLHLYGGGQVRLHQVHDTHLSLLPVATQQDIACELCWSISCQVLPPLSRLIAVQATLALPRLWQLSSEFDKMSRKTLQTVPLQPSREEPSASTGVWDLAREMCRLAGNPECCSGSGSTWHLRPSPAHVEQLAEACAGMDGAGAVEAGIGVERWGKVRALSMGLAYKWPGVLSSTSSHPLIAASHRQLLAPSMNDSTRGHAELPHDSHPLPKLEPHDALYNVGHGSQHHARSDVYGAMPLLTPPPALSDAVMSALEDPLASPEPRAASDDAPHQETSFAGGQPAHVCVLESQQQEASTSDRHVNTGHALQSSGFDMAGAGGPKPMPEFFSKCWVDYADPADPADRAAKVYEMDLLSMSELCFLERKQPWRNEPLFFVSAREGDGAWCVELVRNYKHIVHAVCKELNKVQRDQQQGAATKHGQQKEQHHQRQPRQRSRSPASRRAENPNKQQQQQQQPRAHLANLSHNQPVSTSSTEGPHTKPFADLRNVRLWEQLDTYAHELAQYLLSRNPASASISEVIKGTPYPRYLSKLMKPSHFYRHFNDLFFYVGGPRTQDACLRLTEAGARLGQCTMPDVSSGHQSAIDDAIEAGAMDVHREKDIELLRSLFSDSAWPGFRVAVVCFRQNVTERLRRGKGRLALSELQDHDVPRPLQSWLAKDERSVAWFVGRMLPHTFQLRSEFARAEDDATGEAVFICNVLLGSA